MVHVGKSSIFGLLMAFPVLLDAQNAHTRQAKASTEPQKVIVITGARFTYPLIENWIEAYSKVNPEIQIIVESRGSSDPLHYEILAEVYEHPAEIKQTRQYLYIARYAILPVARTGSGFATYYADKGLHRDDFRRVFFHDMFAEREKQKLPGQPFTVYTRLQTAGVPAVFAKHFGYEQKDINGTGIAGADSHLLTAMLRDPAGVSYLPTPLIYDEHTRKPIEGLTVLPPDLDDNKKVTGDEKFYGHADETTARLEKLGPNETRNIALGYLHLSVDKQSASDEAIEFLKWIQQNGLKDLHRFGFLLPEKDRLEENSFTAFARRRGNQ